MDDERDLKPDLDLEDEDEIEDIEAYCVRCRDTVTIEDPVAVWTRKGLPAMKGECPSCGGTVYRLGKTAMHERLNRPSAVNVAGTTRQKVVPETVYINAAPTDSEFVEQLAADLQKMGNAVWIHDADPQDVNWAGGVHPALRECGRMVLVLSPAALSEPSVQAAWEFFRGKGKPVVVARIAQADPPDALRRRPRFDFAADYKIAFRQMLQAIASGA